MTPLRRRLVLAALTVVALAAGASTAHADAMQPGLKAEYFDYTDLTGKVAERIDLAVNFNWGLGEPVPGVGDDFSARWTGVVTPQHTEEYTFITRSDDGVRLWIDGESVIDDWSLHAASERSGKIALEAGKAYDLRLEYFDGLKNGSVRLSWRSESQPKQVVPTSALATAVADPDPGTDPDPDPGADPDPDPGTGPDPGSDPDPDPGTDPDPDPGSDPDPDPQPDPDPDPPAIELPKEGGVAAVVVPAGDLAVPQIVPGLELPLLPSFQLPGDAPSIVSYGGPLDPPAPPVAGETFNATPSGEGDVLVRRPADGQLIPLDRGASLPVGTHVDTREGGVELQTAPAAGVDRPTQDMHFEGGMFAVGQRTRGSRVVEIDLLHGEFAEACGPLSKAERRAIRRRGAIARAAGRQRVLRRLWGKGKGRFRTRGRHAAATVRGTSWSIADRCDETSVRVHEGVVDVENLLTGNVVTLTAGERTAVRP
ncbi:MAG TPA: PA14 domain-containing protein [Solirubrobacteraceae bacterium]|jgi:hypothetical protein